MTSILKAGETGQVVTLTHHLRAPGGARPGRSARAAEVGLAPTGDFERPPGNAAAVLLCSSCSGIATMGVGLAPSLRPSAHLLPSREKVSTDSLAVGTPLRRLMGRRWRAAPDEGGATITNIAFDLAVITGSSPAHRRSGLIPRSSTSGVSLSSIRAPKARLPNEQPVGGGRVEDSRVLQAEPEQHRLCQDRLACLTVTAADEGLSPFVLETVRRTSTRRARRFVSTGTGSGGSIRRPLCHFGARPKPRVACGEALPFATRSGAHGLPMRQRLAHAASPRRH